MLAGMVESTGGEPMNDVERLESMRGRVQHLGTVSQDDTRWLWEMARRSILAAMRRHALSALLDEPEPTWTLPVIPPLEPPRKRCRECGGEGGVASGLHGREFADCPACGGSGYREVSDD